jgi:hypothetical protein
MHVKEFERHGEKRGRCTSVGRVDDRLNVLDDVHTLATLLELIKGHGEDAFSDLHHTVQVLLDSSVLVRFVFFAANACDATLVSVMDQHHIASNEESLVLAYTSKQLHDLLVDLLLGGLQSRLKIEGGERERARPFDVVHSLHSSGTVALTRQLLLLFGRSLALLLFLLLPLALLLASSSLERDG